MNILLNKGELESNSTNVNFVATFDKVYLMDNHLVAFWCWSKLSLKKEYTLIHMDRHYDLRPYNETYKQIHEINWKEIELEEITNFKVSSKGIEAQLLRWDNYINLFCKRNPRFFKNTIFVTEERGAFDYEGEYEIRRVHNLLWDLKKEDNTILNLDIDFFFTRIGERTIQKYTDEYVSHVGDWILREYENFSQIIICLSPECSISWKEAKRVANIILEKFNQKIE